MRTANPALNEKVFRVRAENSNERMTLGGTVHKSIFMLLLMMMSSTFVWNQFMAAQIPGQAPVVPSSVLGLSGVGMIGGLIFFFITMFKKHWAAWTGSIYCLLQGLFLGGISSVFESMYPGIVIQAIGLTLFTAASLLFLYVTGAIKATENFKLGIAAATGAIFLIYMTSFILGFFGIQIPFIHESGLIGIGFSIFVVTIAALNLVLDFDFIEEGASSGAPKYMEWFASFGLMVTLVWLYVEILRLLAKLRER